jgi:hypothetical protein
VAIRLGASASKTCMGEASLFEDRFKNIHLTESEPPDHGRPPRQVHVTYSRSKSEVHLTNSQELTSHCLLTVV